METTSATPLDYSGIDGGVRYEVFNSCYEQGLRGEALETEYHHQLRSLIPKPLAEAAIGNMPTVVGISEVISGNTTTPSRTIVSVKEKS